MARRPKSAPRSASRSPAPAPGKPGPFDWPMVGLDAWVLGVESSWVIWLRCMRLAGGGAVANQEAVRMVAEKVRAQTELAAELASGSFGTDPSAVASRTIGHYSKRVRANRARLTR